MGLINLPTVSDGKQAEMLGAPYNLGSLASMLTGVRTNSGQYVTPERAMRSAAVLACIHILCADLASLPLSLFRRTPQGAVLATDHSLYPVLHDSPNPWQTSMELRESMILDVLCFGQSFTEKIIGPSGVERLYPLSAGRVTYVDPISMYLPPDPPLMCAMQTQPPGTVSFSPMTFGPCGCLRRVAPSTANRLSCSPVKPSAWRLRRKSKARGCFPKACRRTYAFDSGHTR